ncbi:AGZA family xanthine/uracil permease-like MFS transporter [Fusibacter tunisiensis]|uniref:AGZA family xanthine/uracil permease-like MFS transporter n=2 Tax=Fusibacter tunisiensis TaxID=1008308 RepID=A0ABS2MPP4_9FIRM|nr:AGZA family xanthine/uracil permease-like MFS transporter [Fusibacter tunisiensis]
MEKNIGFFEKTFRLKEHGTNVRTEIIAGFTTFMTMAYILIVNPLTLEAAGMDFMKVFTATALSSVIATLVMGLVAKLPFALAPGMGLNAFFAYTVVIGMGKSFEFALTAVFLEGIIFLLLTGLNVREAIINSIPSNIKKAISVGIGLFIAFIGLANAGIIIQGATPLELGDITTGAPLLALIGLIIAGVLLAFKVKGALFIAIIATTLIGIPMGQTLLPDKIVSAPTAPYFFNFVWSEILSFDMLMVLFVFLFVDMFDTVGTLVGVSTKAGMMTEDGKVPNAKKALFADAVGTTVGAIFGTSTVTTYVESASGVAEGGRTGLTSLVTAGLFAIALLLSPLFIMIPSAATAPALILVGLFMISPIKEIDFEDFTEAIPAFLTLLMMPLTYSISDGIVFGMLSYVILKALTGRFKEVHLLTWIVAAFFVVKLLV